MTSRDVSTTTAYYYYLLQLLLLLLLLLLPPLSCVQVLTVDYTFLEACVLIGAFTRLYLKAAGQLGNRAAQLYNSVLIN